MVHHDRGGKPPVAIGPHHGGTMRRRLFVVIGLLAAAAGLAACSSQPPTTSTPTDHPSAATPGPSPTPINASGSAPAVAVALNLADPQPLLAALPVVETDTIVNPGPALSGLDVHVGIGTKHAGNGPTGFQNTVLDWWSAAAAKWINVALTADANGVMQGVFPSDIPTGQTSLQLRINLGTGFLTQQYGNQAPVTISLVGGDSVVGQQQLTLPVRAPTVAVTSQPTTMQRTGQAEFDVTIQNSTGATYPTFGADLIMSCRTATRTCSGSAGGAMLSGFRVDWFDGTAWSPLTVNLSGGGTVVESSPLPTGTQQIRVRLSFATAELDPAAATVSLSVFVGPPDAFVTDVASVKANDVAITS
jgi:hypothetical protein